MQNCEICYLSARASQSSQCFVLCKFASFFFFLNQADMFVVVVVFFQWHAVLSESIQAWVKQSIHKIARFPRPQKACRSNWKHPIYSNIWILVSEQSIAIDNDGAWRNWSSGIEITELFQDNSKICLDTVGRSSFPFVEYQDIDRRSKMYNGVDFFICNSL